MLANTQKRADLHVHTYYSDGTFSPEEVVRYAAKLKLAAVGICDHDCTDGIKEAHEAALDYGVEIVPGVEITSEKEGIEIHILGYFVDTETRSLADVISKLRNNRVDRIYKMVEKLKEHNVDISPERVFALGGKGSISRLHLATALYREGIVGSISEAFKKYIGDGGPCYVTRFNISPEETIKAILNSGGVPVVAHPKIMKRDDLIPSFVNAGLRGLEAYHTDHRKAVSSHYAALAQKLGLIVTGGSDCHGYGKAKILMGSVTMPYSTVDELKREKDRIRSER